MAIVLNMPLAFMNAAGSVLAAFYIDKVGRRYIILRSLPGILVSCIIVSIGMYLSNYDKGE